MDQTGMFDSVAFYSFCVVWALAYIGDMLQDGVEYKRWPCSVASACLGWTASYFCIMHLMFCLQCSHLSSKLPHCGHFCTVASSMDAIALLPNRVEKNITRIDVTTTRTVNVEQLSRDVKASIGSGNILMSAIMTNLHDVPSYLSELDVIIHIARKAHVEDPSANSDQNEQNEQNAPGPPPKKMRVYEED